MCHVISSHVSPVTPGSQKTESVPLVIAQQVQTEAQRRVSTSGVPGHQRGFTDKGVVGVCL